MFVPKIQLHFARLRLYKVTNIDIRVLRRVALNIENGTRCPSAQENLPSFDKWISPVTGPDLHFVGPVHEIEFVVS